VEYEDAVRTDMKQDTHTAHIQTKRSISRFQPSTGTLNDAAIRASISHLCVSYVQHVAMNAIPTHDARAHTHTHTRITVLRAFNITTRVLSPVVIHLKYGPLPYRMMCYCPIHFPYLIASPCTISLPPLFGGYPLQFLH